MGYPKRTESKHTQESNDHVRRSHDDPDGLGRREAIDFRMSIQSFGDIKMAGQASTQHSIEFDPVYHVYRVGGVVRPSTTTIIGAAGLIDDQYFTEESRDRGKAVHLATGFLDERDLDVKSVLPEHRPYVDAWVKFRNQTEFEPDRIEHRVYHPVFGYCGTLDRTGRFGDGSIALCDLKTGLEAAWHPIQLASYSYALEQEGVKANSFRKMTVMLRRDGTFKVKEYPASEYRDNWNTFLSCLNLWNFRMEKMGGRAR